MEDKVLVIPHSPSIFNFQKCTIGVSVLDHLEQNSSGSGSGGSVGWWDKWLSIECPSRPSKILTRCCRSRIGDVAQTIQTDLRVEILQQTSRTSRKVVVSDDDDELSPVSPAGNGESDSSYGKKKCLMLGDASSGWEMDVGRHLAWKMNESELNSCRDLDEEGNSSTMRFNDALWCTSKTIQMLKSGTIKMMRLTVISDSSLSDFLYQTNQKRSADTQTSLNSQGITAAKEEETTTSVRGGVSNDQRRRSHDKSHSSSSKVILPPSWKLLREKIHQAFQSYDIHVMSNSLVDLRKCPLSCKGKFLCPQVSFVFVEECLMRTPESDVHSAASSSPPSIVVGRVTNKTEIIINHVLHISHFTRLVSSQPKKEDNNNKALILGEQDTDTGDEEKLFGLENAANLLSSLIEMHAVVQKTQEQHSQRRVLVGNEPWDCNLPRDSLDNFYSHGLLIVGPSGSGKSLVVRETVKKLRAALLVFDSARVVSSSGTNNNSGGQDFVSLCETWTEIFIKSIQSAQMSPTVLLLPKINELLLIKQNKSRSLVGRLVNHVCNLFDGIPKNSPLIVVATTDKAYDLPTKLRRTGRFEKEVYIGAPSEEQRFNILKSLSKKVPSLGKLDLDSVAKRTPGYVGQDLIRVAHLAILKSYEENCSQVSEDHIKYALARILPSVLQGSLGVVGIQRITSLDHIAGLHSVKLDLIKAIVWPLKYPHAFRRMGIAPPKGILLHSPPGCAKTTLVRAVAASHQTNFLSVSAAELFSSGVGDSEKIVTDLFHRARMASPCILFIDELEAIVGSRQMSNKREKSTNDSILSSFLTEMDGVGTKSPACLSQESESNSDSLGPMVLVVAATNRIDMIDSALIRPGRFDKLIYVPPLDKDGRLELLRICSKTTPISADLEKIALETESYSGAELVNMVREAAMFALTDDMNSEIVSDKHFAQAMELLKTRTAQAHS